MLLTFSDSGSMHQAGLGLLIALALAGGVRAHGQGDEAGANLTSVVVSFTGVMPTVVASKVGKGKFTVAKLANGKLTLQLPAGTVDFSVAYLCPGLAAGTALSIDQYVLNANIKDGRAYSEKCQSNMETGKLGVLSMDVDASAVADTSYVSVFAQNRKYVAIDTAYKSGKLEVEAPIGTDRVDILAYSQSVTDGLYDSELLAIRDYSRQPVPGSIDPGHTIVLNAADETHPVPISYRNVPAGFGTPTTQVEFYPGDAVSGLPLAVEATASYRAVPDSLVKSGDFITFWANANRDGASGSSGSSVEQIVVLASARPVTVSFPAPWRYSGPSPAALPVVEFKYAGFAGRKMISRSASLSWSANQTTEDVYEVYSTPNYADGATSVTFPNLAGLKGFLASPSAMTKVIWMASIYENYPDPQPESLIGLVESIVGNWGTYSVP